MIQSKSLPDSGVHKATPEAGKLYSLEFTTNQEGLVCEEYSTATVTIMQPGRPFLHSLQATFLRHIKGKVHSDDPGSVGNRSRRHAQRCMRPERVDSDPREAPLERSDIVPRVLAAVKSCAGVDSSQVTELSKFEEDLKMEKGDVVVLVLAMLKKYGLSLSYVEARKMTTCAEVIDFIESQVCQDHDHSGSSDELDGDQ